MKKIIGITLALMLASMASFAQVAATEAVSTEKVEKCIPTKACAEKAGMTLAECKKKCLGDSKAENSSSDATAVASVSMEASIGAKDKKCCASVKECVEKTGMTVAECKAKCMKEGKITESTQEKETKVAAATLVNDIEEVQLSKTEVKKCCKSSAACKKKQG